MDPKSIERAHAAMISAMRALDAEYVALLQRLGCKQITLHH